MTDVTQEKATEAAKKRTPKKVALRFDPYRDGCRDLGGNPAFPPLRSRRFAVRRTSPNGKDVEFQGLTVRAQPQLNLDNQLWGDLKKEIPQIDELIRKGAIEEYYPDNDSRADSTAGYSVDTAQAIIQETRDIERLRTWAKIETRQSVQSAIEAQITALNQGEV